MPGSLLKNVGLVLNRYRADVMASGGCYEREPNVGEKDVTIPIIWLLSYALHE